MSDRNLLSPPRSDTASSRPWSASGAEVSKKLILSGSIMCNLAFLYLVQERLAESEAALKAALRVARELGNVRLESVAQCGLGFLIERQGRTDEAQAQIEAAVRLMRTSGDPLAEGRSVGFLGLLHARQGRHDDARRCLDSSEALLRSASDAVGLGELLIGRTEAHHLVGDARAAKASLAAGEAIALEVGAGLASGIGIALARVRALIEPTRS